MGKTYRKCSSWDDDYTSDNRKAEIEAKRRQKAAKKNEWFDENQGTATDQDDRQ